MTKEGNKMGAQRYIFTRLVCIFLIGSSSALAFSGFGFGTATDPYVITNVDQLQEMKNDPNAAYILGNDIDASGTKYWNDETGFKPVSTFRGSLDGQGHVISNLYINRINKEHQGLFGYLVRATIQNLIFVNADISFSRHGGILAANANQSVIRQCWATGKITVQNGRGGGLIGNVREGSWVDQCFADVEVTAAPGSGQVGGLIGYLRGRGYTPIAKLTNSFSYGTVIGGSIKLGNLVGDADGSFIDKCYSCGSEKALIGFNYRGPKITNCYWDNEVGASSSPYGGVPATTEQMTHRSTYVGWDFEEIWSIDEGESYPYFRKWKD
jgi:hypothetical protein